MHVVPTSKPKYVLLIYVGAKSFSKISSIYASAIETACCWIIGSALVRTVLLKTLINAVAAILITTRVTTISSSVKPECLDIFRL